MDLLKKLIALEIKAREFGFQWETSEQIIAQIQSEIIEIDVHLKDHDKQKLQEEIGDLLHAVFSLCIFCQFDPEETLQNSIVKFEKRFLAIQQISKEEGLPTLNGQSFQKLMALWDKAKKVTK